MSVIWRTCDGATVSGTNGRRQQEMQKRQHWWLIRAWERECLPVIGQIWESCQSDAFGCPVFANQSMRDQVFTECPSVQNSKQKIPLTSQCKTKTRKLRVAFHNLTVEPRLRLRGAPLVGKNYNFDGGKLRQGLAQG